jgi:hypothetical protein
MSLIQTTGIILLNLMVMGAIAQALTAPAQASGNEQAIAQAQDYSPPKKDPPKRSDGVGGTRNTGGQQ